jgi:hypothetical protein
MIEILDTQWCFRIGSSVIDNGMFGADNFEWEMAGGTQLICLKPLGEAILVVGHLVLSLGIHFGREQAPKFLQ